MRLETHEAWRAFFTGLAADRPAIVVVEDIHWADDPLLDLLEELADRVAGPLLFVCPARPDLAQRRTGWGGGKRNFSSIFLEPLSHDDAPTLVEVLLAVEDLPDETREAMLARADGNPLFLEEIIRQLIDEGRIVRDGAVGGRPRTSRRSSSPTPSRPCSPRASTCSPRSSGARSCPRPSSVGCSGTVRSRGCSRTATSGGRRPRRLEDRELVLSQLGSRIAGEREFLFKHVLTRDVAYGTLARRDRARAHADVAAWIESAAGERQREFADLLAHHLGLAYEGSLADPGVSADRRDELRLRCLDAALAASAEAQSRMLLDKANAFGEAALDVAADAHERSLALEALGLCALWHYRGDDAWRYLSQAVDERLAGDRGSGEDIAMLCARAVESPTRWPASMADQPEEALWPAMSRSASSTPRPTARRAFVSCSRAACGSSRSAAGFTEDDAERARRAREEAFALAEALGRDDLASAALDGVGSIEFIVGLHGLTLPVVERRLEIVERLTDPWEIGDALQTAADTALAVGRYEDARRWASEGFERASGGPDVWRAGLAWRAIARFKLGDWDGAIDDFERMEAARATTKFGTVGYFTLTMWTCIALLYELRGERAAADRLVAGMVPELPGTATIRRIPWLARLAAHRGSDEALARIEESRSLVGRDMAKGAILEAQCDVIAELSTVISRARRLPTHGSSRSRLSSRLSRSIRTAWTGVPRSRAATRPRPSTSSLAQATASRRSGRCGRLRSPASGRRGAARGGHPRRRASLGGGGARCVRRSRLGARVRAVASAARQARVTPRLSRPGHL